MKTLNFKNILPALVMAAGIGGAFLTTSMQSAPENAPKNGFTRNPSTNKCTSVQTNCDDVPKPEMCRINGQIAYDKVGNNDCLQALYRPN
ncbi:DUF6520 family protein [Flavobacterium sp. YO64]|uniref:DUF6520 family protein n=1 Tax=Flavobacterium sp. YO64 TaxID=394559 RepID=UPI000D421B07|nr:DUF6520 family protein [Flavobacterium sp. YO64]PTT17942.1 hypothetical protein DBR27_01015 [Flavobacterium sp. HMWF030]RXM45542.1 hypothetical protein BOW57_05435 [Flavobacterium sp. YO64]